MIFSTESKDWKIVYQTKDGLQSELIKNDLESNDVPCFIVNRKDSNYPIFGKYDLYVQAAKTDIATVIIKRYLENDDLEN